MYKINRGKKFESDIQQSCKKQGILFERYKDNGKFGFSNETRFSSQNPCDGHIYDGDLLLYIEMKSTINSSVSFPLPYNDKKQKKMIKTHQILSLLDRSQYKNVVCGLLIDYADRKTKTKEIIGSCWFIEINKFVEWTKTCNKSSINADDCLQIGIQVHKQKKKVNYTYNMNELLQIVKNK